MKNWQSAASDRCTDIFSRHRAALTLGGEPTFIPMDPEGPEWSYSAVGPTKLGYARKMAHELLKGPMRGGIDFFTPGKSYPGEVNPRWAIRLLANRNRTPILRPRGTAAPTRASIGRLMKKIAGGLGVRTCWQRLRDPSNPKNRVWALLLDENEGKWNSFAWPAGSPELTGAPGPAGLRLPLHLLGEKIPRRALTLEWTGDTLAIFLPPVLQPPFLRLLQEVEKALFESGIGRVEMQGYVPSDELGCWTHIGLAADPGVLEVNLPACADWREYDFWTREVTRAAGASGLRPWKQLPGAHPEGTGGGNHLLFGGASIEENPFFTRPRWMASILRYWQKHPSLAYLFTGCYVGASSQAPRADESARDLHDLEMACAFLEALPDGDHRNMISETLRHLQTDVTGNSHRSEISLDKFWNPGWPSGTLGLIEFRAIESLPEPEWMSAVALLWTSLAAHLLHRQVRGPLKRFEGSLHDRFFLPSILWRDLTEVLSDLDGGGFRFDRELFRKIWEWKFPKLLGFRSGDATLDVRRAHESWPLLCETPVDGGTTSRFVDTSMQRIELVASESFARNFSIRINGRPIRLTRLERDFWIAGLRYRRTNLYPSLHPGLPPQLPLALHIGGPDTCAGFVLGAKDIRFRKAKASAGSGQPCKAGRRGELTFDLRIP